jgi:hypothetical protein
LTVEDGVSLTLKNSSDVEVVSSLTANGDFTLDSNNNNSVLNLDGPSTVQGNFTVGPNGNFSLGATLTLQGNLNHDNTRSSFEAGDETVLFSSGGDQSIRVSEPEDNPFYNVTIDGEGTNANFDSGVQVDNELVLDDDGTSSAGGNNTDDNVTLVLDNGSGNGTTGLTMRGTFDDNTSGTTGDRFNANTRQVTFNIADGNTADVFGSNLSFDYFRTDGPSSGQGTVELEDPITVGNNLDLNSNLNVDLKGNDLNLANPGSTVDIDGTISSSGGALRFVGGGTTNLEAVNTTVAPITVAEDGGGNATTVDLTGLPDGATLTIGGDLTVQGGSTFDAGTSQGSFDISGNVDVQDSGSFILSENSSGQTYNVSGNFLVDSPNGSFTNNNRTVVFDGGDQNIGAGSGDKGVDFHTLDMQSSTRITINSSISGRVGIQQDLKLTSGGEFVTNGQLTLRSERSTGDGSQDAAIVRSGGDGTLTSTAGDRAQRFISEGSDFTGGDDVGDPANDGIGDDAGYRLLSHPFSGSISASQLTRISNGTDDDQLVEELPDGGQSSGNLGNSMIFRYDSGSQTYESQDGNSNTDGDFQMEQGRGYLVFFFDDQEDPINNGSGSNAGLTFDAGGSQALTDFGSTPTVTSLPDAGGSSFHLVGNPYPAGYDVGEMVINGTALKNFDGDEAFSSSLERVVAVGGNNTTESFGSGNIAASWQGFYIEQTGSVGSSFNVEFPPAGVVGGSSSDEVYFKSQPKESTNPRFDLALEKRTNPRASLASYGTQDKAAFLFRDDAAAGQDNFDSAKLTLPTTATSRNGNTIGLETSILAIERTSDGSTTYLDQDARPTPASFPETYNLQFDCANLSSSTTYRIDLSEAENLPSDWIIRIKDTQTDSEQILYGGDGTSVQSDAQPYSFSVDASACGSSVESKSASAGGGPAVLYDGSLTGASSKAVTGSRFKLELTNESTLPVELNGFNGNVEGQDAVLTWETASETNNAGFQVQRKRDGSFRDLQGAFVESKATSGGTTNRPQSYRYRVDDLDPGTHTFRLRQVDTDGTDSFSDPIDVEVGLSGQYSLSTYPNPVRDQATVKFAVKEQAEVTISLYNTLGQRVKTLYRDTPAAEQTQRATLGTGDLSSGLYIVRLRGPGFTATERVTVVK